MFISKHQHITTIWCKQSTVIYPEKNISSMSCLWNKDLIVKYILKVIYDPSTCNYTDTLLATKFFENIAEQTK